MLRATWLLFVTHLVRVATSKRALLCLVVALLPVAAALLVVLISQSEGPPPALIIGWSLEVQLVVPLIALVAGSGVVAEEIEDKTISYLLVRPIPRASILFGRYLASAVFVCAVLLASTWAMTTVLELAGSGHEQGLTSEATRRLMLVAPLGGAVYTAIFATLGTLLARPILFGMGYTFAIEVFVANFPGTSQRLTVQYYLKSLFVGDAPDLAERLDEALIAVELVGPSEALRTLAWILVGALALGAWVVSRRQVVLAA